MTRAPRIWEATGCGWAANKDATNWRNSWEDYMGFLIPAVMLAIVIGGFFAATRIKGRQS